LLQSKGQLGPGLDYSQQSDADEAAIADGGSGTGSSSG
jgi:hypothetical protein